MESYVWFEGRVDVGPAAMQTETSGAKASHGDRVIAVALANYGRRQQEKGSDRFARFYSENSFMARKEAKERKEERDKANGKVVWYN